MFGKGFELQFVPEGKATSQQSSSFTIKVETHGETIPVHVNTGQEARVQHHAPSCIVPHYIEQPIRV